MSVSTSKNNAYKKATPSIREIVYGMSVEDFRRVAFEEIGDDYNSTHLLGELAIVGADKLSDHDKSVARKLLSKFGISQNRLRNPEALQEAINALVGRLASVL